MHDEGRDACKVLLPNFQSRRGDGTVLAVARFDPCGGEKKGQGMHSRGTRRARADRPAVRPIANHRRTLLAPGVARDASFDRSPTG